MIELSKMTKAEKRALVEKYESENPELVQAIRKVLDDLLNTGDIVAIEHAGETVYALPNRRH